MRMIPAKYALQLLLMIWLLLSISSSAEETGRAFLNEPLLGDFAQVKNMKPHVVMTFLSTCSNIPLDRSSCYVKSFIKVMFPQGRWGGECSLEEEEVNVAMHKAMDFCPLGSIGEIEQNNLYLLLNHESCFSKLCQDSSFYSVESTWMEQCSDVNIPSPEPVETYETISLSCMLHFAMTSSPSSFDVVTPIEGSKEACYPPNYGSMASNFCDRSLGPRALNHCTTSSSTSSEVFEYNGISLTVSTFSGDSSDLKLISSFCSLMRELCSTKSLSCLLSLCRHEEETMAPSWSMYTIPSPSPSSSPPTRNLAPTEIQCCETHKGYDYVGRRRLEFAFGRWYWCLVCANPTVSPTFIPSSTPSNLPSMIPSLSPSSAPSAPPSNSPSSNPTVTESMGPSLNPSSVPTKNMIPSSVLSPSPSNPPSSNPTSTQSMQPSLIPSSVPSRSPSFSPTLLALDESNKDIVVVEFYIVLTLHNCTADISNLKTRERVSTIIEDSLSKILKTIEGEARVQVESVEEISSNNSYASIEVDIKVVLSRVCFLQDCSDVAFSDDMLIEFRETLAQAINSGEVTNTIQQEGKIQGLSEVESVFIANDEVPLIRYSVQVKELASSATTKFLSINVVVAFSTGMFLVSQQYNY